MPRSTDLDTIAPDDPVVVENSKPKKQKKVKIIESIDPKEKFYKILGHTKNAFSSFLIEPKVFDFKERNENEQIILVLRPHWFTNVSWILTSIVMFSVPAILGQFSPFNFFSSNFNFILTIFWYLITFAYSFEKFLGWYFNVFIITDHRVIDIDFYNLIDKKFSEAEISRIQDTTSRVSGVSQTLFNYGTVLIQTASETNQIIFEKVSNPEKIIKLLEELRHNESN